MNEELIFITSNADTTGNVIPLLHQIRHALSQLLAQQEETTIDLRRLPLSASEESQLETFLGHGEVKADIQALGDTVLIESRYTGVWLETHYNEEAEIMGKYVHICDCPQLIKSQPEDMVLSLNNIVSDIQSMSDTSTNDAAEED
ncbi:hydrogenase expression protein HupH [Alteromonas sp. RW2A1]|jgi:hydrogenase-1 operon protein HyaF|uniref:hydrogenase expression/formation C-terminal domain-containing protein n=1 Tax=Alteromonas sp. RW2A1 TaxID=1917158 RepID=UPI0009031B6B|nr:hydrogenase expression/formation C-terminal domain-containing protein [Alteromonas sp. RW2A1]APE05207.1 hydrogenase expression protein HupH [Alteromonas sp. RW2A1]